MRVIIVALAFVALAQGQADNVESKVCTPGSTTKIDCNSCFCLQDGSGWACTLMGCNTEVFATATSKGSTSQPEPTVDSSARSKRDNESSNESPEDSTSIENIQVCQPGDTKKVDCNTCFCTNDGSGWGCTRMGCYHGTVISDADTAATQPENL